MKIAKKALVVLMVAMMVASMSAMAFAANTANVEFGEVNDKGVVAVTIYVSDAAGFKSMDWVVNFDASVFTFKKAADGAFSKFYGKKIGEKADPMTAVNDGKAADGVIQGALALVEQVYTDAERDAKIAKAAEDAEDEGETFDVAAKDRANASEARFEIVTLRFEVKDKNAASGKIKVTASGSCSVEVEKDIILKAAEETTAAPVEEKTTEAPKPVEEKTTEAPKPVEEKTTEAPKPVEEKTTEAPKPVEEKTTAAPKPVEEKTTAAPKPVEEKTTAAPADEKTTKADEKATKADEKTTKAEEKATKAPSTTKAAQKDGGVNTGDNMALAAAAGVVALAGAAFVLTKKRK